MPDSQGRHYRFGPFRLDVQTRELRHGDAPVVLTAKAFDVLRLLVEHRDRVVGRDELLGTVWAGRVVEENNLTQAIAALRRAFGTDAHDHRYILTVPGRGYRFVADVDDLSAPAEVARTRPRRPGRHGLRLTAAVLAGLAALGWWLPRDTPQRSPTATAPLALAVLPFRSLPAASKDDLLELGLADTLITRISRSTALRVSPLSSSQRFAGAAQDPVDAARQLGASYVVVGSSQRSGERIKVNVRLLRADGNPLWSGSFDEHIDRVFTLQDRIADVLAGTLAVQVPASIQRSPCDGANADAYRAYLAGQYRTSRPSAALTRRALDDFRRALDLDPTCARAYAAMAHAYRSLVVTADTDPHQDFPRAKALVDKALALDPQLAEAHLARAWIQFWYDWDWAASEASFLRAIALNPSLAEAHFGYAHLLANLGRSAEAAARAREAMTLDPLSPVINAIGGVFVAGQGPTARSLERALELDPDYWLALLMRGAARARAGEVEQARADLQRARQLCGDCSHALTVRATIEHRAGNPGALRQILREMEARDRDGYWPASSLATLHNALGDREGALTLLERAWRERDLRMAFLRVDASSRWRDLRAEPRFIALMQRMEFPPEAGPALRTNTPASPQSSAADRNRR